MSSRATRVDQQVEPFNWRTIHPLGTAAVQTSQPIKPSSARPVESRDQEPVETSLVDLERDTFAKGYAQGERAGAEVASTQADALLRRLTQAIEELAALKGDVLHRAERQVVQLAMAVAHRILQRELDVDRGLLLAMARVALDRLDEHTAATIRLHPDDHAVIMAAPERTWTSEHVQVVADPVIARGGCLVQTDFGLMDVGLDGQFTELARTLLGESDHDRTGDAFQELHGIDARP